MKTGRSFVRSVAGALMGLVLLAVSAHALAGLVGTVDSVDLDARKLVLTQAGTGNQVVLTINNQTVIVTNAGKPLALGDIRKGDGVGIAEVGGVATRINVNPLPVTGILSAVNPIDKKLVVTEAGTDKDFTMVVGDQTPIESKDGKSLELRQLKSGDAVAIFHTGSVAERIVVNVKPDELVGHIKSVGADMKTLVVTELATNADTTVAINEKTTIVTTTGKDLRFQDLKRGDGVGIDHHGGVAERIVVKVKPVH